MNTISNGMSKLTEKLESWGESLIQVLPNLLVAILVVIIFWALSRWVYNLVRQLFAKTEFNKGLGNLMANICRIIVIGLGVVLGLAVLELQKTVFSILAGVGVIGLALGFAFRDLAANFMSGVMLAIHSPIKLGDMVEINGAMGTVIDIRLRDTLIRNSSGQEIFIPNKDFTANQFTNYSSYGKRRIKIEVGVGYEDDASKAVSVVKTALESLDGILSDPAPEAYVGEMAESSVNIFGHVWFKYPGGSYFQIQNNAIIRVKTALESEGFNIPFPIRTLDIPEDLKKALSTDSGKI